MTNVRCAQCGLLNFADADTCKRCKEPVSAQAEAPDFETYAAPRREARSGGRALRWLVALALLAAAGYAAYSQRHRLWYGPDAEYALAIGDAEQFRTPLTVKARRRVTSPNLGVPTVMAPAEPDAVFVLEARGLVSFGPVETESRVTGTVYAHSNAGAGLGETPPPPQKIETKVNFDTTLARLTPEGEAEGWEQADDGSWLVPVGTREVLRVVKVGEVEAAAGVETREVEFAWRWVPDGVGEAFDTAGKVYGTMSETAREAARGFNWSSAHAYRAVALLERGPGGRWLVRRIRKSEDFDEKTELSAF